MSTAAARTRLLRWQDPAPLAAAFHERGGLAMLRAVADGTLAMAPMTELLGLRLEEVDEGHTVWSVEPGEEHHNEAGLIHGGLAAVLLDTALGTTLLSAVPPGTRAASVNLSVDFLRPLTPGMGRIRCAGQIVRLGSRIAVADAQLRDERAGELLARATSTFSIVRATPAGR
jgi:uncharacterized protein (TIGR00369 family)